MSYIRIVKNLIKMILIGAFFAMSAVNVSAQSWAPNTPGDWSDIDDDFEDEMECDSWQRRRIKKVRRKFVKRRKKFVRLMEDNDPDDAAKLAKLERKIARDEKTFNRLNASCETVAGIWKSQGYGYVADILKDSKQTTYNITASTCLKDEDYDNDESVINDYDLFELSDDGKYLRVANADDLPYFYTFKRSNTLPTTCLLPPDDSPQATFESFVAYFSEHYSFFDVYGVNWDQLANAARGQVNDWTTDVQLFNILKGMLSDVKDGHVSIEGADSNGDELFFDAKPFNIDLAVEQYAQTHGISEDDAFDLFTDNYKETGIEEHILHGQAKSDSTDTIIYGLARPDIGYIAITAEEGFGNGDLDVDQEIRRADKHIKRAIKKFNRHDVTSVIIDLSYNEGGLDAVSRVIASRFTDSRVFAYKKAAGDFPVSQDTSIFIDPADDGPCFTGTVYLVTSHATISAGEVLTLSLRSLPNVTHVGEATSGAFSDLLAKKLSNEWEISLSNEIYTDSDGVVWEGQGAEPQISLPIWDLNNPMGSSHRDAIDTLIDLIEAN